MHRRRAQPANVAVPSEDISDARNAALDLRASSPATARDYKATTWSPTEQTPTGTPAPYPHTENMFMDFTSALSVRSIAIDVPRVSSTLSSERGQRLSPPIGVPLSATYADATNLAEQFPEFASAILAQPLAANVSSRAPREPRRKRRGLGAVDAGPLPDHANTSPNWALSSSTGNDTTTRAPRNRRRRRGRKNGQTSENSPDVSSGQDDVARGADVQTMRIAEADATAAGSLNVRYDPGNRNHDQQGRREERHIQPRVKLAAADHPRNNSNALAQFISASHMSHGDPLISGPGGSTDIQLHQEKQSSVQLHANGYSAPNPTAISSTSISIDDLVAQLQPWQTQHLVEALSAALSGAQIDSQSSDIQQELNSRQHEPYRPPRNYEAPSAATTSLHDQRNFPDSWYTPQVCDTRTHTPHQTAPSFLPDCATETTKLPSKELEWRRRTPSGKYVPPPIALSRGTSPLFVAGSDSAPHTRYSSPFAELPIHANSTAPVSQSCIFPPSPGRRVDGHNFIASGRRETVHASNFSSPAPPGTGQHFECSSQSALRNGALEPLSFDLSDEIHAQAGSSLLRAAASSHTAPAAPPLKSDDSAEYRKLFVDREPQRDIMLGRADDPSNNTRDRVGHTGADTKALLRARPSPTSVKENNSGGRSSAGQDGWV